MDKNDKKILEAIQNNKDATFKDLGFKSYDEMGKRVEALHVKNYIYYVNEDKAITKDGKEDYEILLVDLNYVEINE